MRNQRQEPILGVDLLNLMTSQNYEIRCDPHRRNGCEEHVIIATSEAYSKFRSA
jgi:hypothetical protein